MCRLPVARSTFPRKDFVFLGDRPGTNDGALGTGGGAPAGTKDGALGTVGGPRDCLLPDEGTKDGALGTDGGRAPLAATFIRFGEDCIPGGPLDMAGGAAGSELRLTGAREFAESRFFRIGAPGSGYCGGGGPGSAVGGGPGSALGLGGGPGSVEGGPPREWNRGGGIGSFLGGPGVPGFAHFGGPGMMDSLALFSSASRCLTDASFCSLVTG